MPETAVNGKKRKNALPSGGAFFISSNDGPVLSRDFFARPTLDVARELLGKSLYYKGRTGFITETEAYVGRDDPACHAAKGRTKRTDVMFGPAGFSYVYLIYGMYYCLNFVTEDEGFPAAVLIRGLLTDGKTHHDGPGKLCRHLGISTGDNRIDVTNDPDFHIRETGLVPAFDTTPRIGISQGKEKLWRFVIRYMR